jgi:hypothetical protein
LEENAKWKEAEIVGLGKFACFLAEVGVGGDVIEVFHF